MTKLLTIQKGDDEPIVISITEEGLSLLTNLVGVHNLILDQINLINQSINNLINKKDLINQSDLIDRSDLINRSNQINRSDQSDRSNQNNYSSHSGQINRFDQSNQSDQIKSNQEALNGVIDKKDWLRLEGIKGIAGLDLDNHSRDERFFTAVWAFVNHIQRHGMGKIYNPSGFFSRILQNISPAQIAKRREQNSVKTVTWEESATAKERHLRPFLKMLNGEKEDVGNGDGNI